MKARKYQHAYYYKHMFLVTQHNQVQYIPVNNMVSLNINSMYNISLETNMNIQDAKCIIYKTEHSSFQIIHLINTNTLNYMLSLPFLLPLPLGGLEPLLSTRIISSTSSARTRGSCVGVFKLPACDGVLKVLVPKPDVFKVPKLNCCIYPGDSIDLEASRIGVEPPGNGIFAKLVPVSDPATTVSSAVYVGYEESVVVVIPPLPDAAAMVDEDAVVVVYGTVTLP